jgi:hypothetical protein
MSARTETLGAGSHGVRLAWYLIALAALLMLSAALVATRPSTVGEPVARPNVAVEAPAGAISPGASAAERSAVRQPFVRTHGAGDFRGTVKSSISTSTAEFDPARLPGAFRGTVKAGTPTAGTTEDQPPWARIAPYRR